MRGLYAHASQQMREKLAAALQARWEESLRQRAAIDPQAGLFRWLRSQESYLAPASENGRSRGSAGSCIRPVALHLQCRVF